MKYEILYDDFIVIEGYKLFRIRDIKKILMFEVNNLGGYVDENTNVYNNVVISENAYVNNSEIHICCKI